jgi:hypothetical protein
MLTPDMLLVAHAHVRRLHELAAAERLSQHVRRRRRETPARVAVAAPAARPQLTSVR